jgi:hypothetical protein
VRYPLSVDKTVWPSRFRIGQEVLQFDKDILVDSATGNSYFMAFGLWEGLGEMIAEYVPCQGGDCAIAVFVYVPDASVDDRAIVGGTNDSWWTAIMEAEPQPSDIQDDWIELGYDVANSGFLSALSNCGFSDDERDKMRALWRSQINHIGLLADLDAAKMYCVDAHRRAASDGPFFVFKLFLVWGPRL